MVHRHLHHYHLFLHCYHRHHHYHPLLFKYLVSVIYVFSLLFNSYKAHIIYSSNINCIIYRVTDWDDNNDHGGDDNKWSSKMISLTYVCFYIDHWFFCTSAPASSSSAAAAAASAFCNLCSFVEVIITSVREGEKERLNFEFSIINWIKWIKTRFFFWHFCVYLFLIQKRHLVFTSSSLILWF